MDKNALAMYRRFCRNAERLYLKEYPLKQYDADLRACFHEQLAHAGVAGEKLNSAICYVPGGLILKFETKEVAFEDLFDARCAAE
jgi:hypothetical protein